MEIDEEGNIAVTLEEAAKMTARSFKEIRKSKEFKEASANRSRKQQEENDEAQS